MKWNTHKIALMGILTAGAIIIAILESFIPSIGIPGVKLGLANIVILIILYEIGIIEAIIVDLLRVFIVALLRGTIASMGFLMSLTGAALSLGIMILLYLLVKKFSIVLGTPYMAFYLPIIAVSAIITGVLVGIVAQLIIRTGIIKKQKEKYKF